MNSKNTEYFCIKRNLLITTSNCSQCFKEGKSGYEKYSACIAYNLVTKRDAEKLDKE